MRVQSTYVKATATYLTFQFVTHTNEVIDSYTITQ